MCISRPKVAFFFVTNFKFYLIVETVQFPAKTHIRNYFSVNREAANIAVESVGKKIGDSMPINCSFTLSGSFGNQKYLAITLIKPQWDQTCISTTRWLGVQFFLHIRRYYQQIARSDGLSLSTLRHGNAINSGSFWHFSKKIYDLRCQNEMKIEALFFFVFIAKLVASHLEYIYK